MQLLWNADGHMPLAGTMEYGHVGSTKWKPVGHYHKQALWNMAREVP